MNSEDSPFPPPNVIEQQAAAMPSKVPLRDYCGAMGQLRRKGYSYREIAEWMSEALGTQINRHQVVYVMAADSIVDPHRVITEERQDQNDHLQAMIDQVSSVPDGYEPIAPADNDKIPSIAVPVAHAVPAPKKVRQKRKAKP